MASGLRRVRSRNSPHNVLAWRALIASPETADRCGRSLIAVSIAVTIRWQRVAKRK